MAVYRFRVKLAEDPTSLWRDITIGGRRTIEEFQTTLNDAVGLDQDHLWFFGIDEDYWDSDVKCQHPEEYEESASGNPIGYGEETYNATMVTIGEMIDQLGLEVGDRICYLYDYGDEWRFYGLVKEINEDEPSNTEPEVVNEKGGSVEQYPSAEER